MRSRQTPFQAPTGPFNIAAQAVQRGYLRHGSSSPWKLAVLLQWLSGHTWVHFWPALLHNQYSNSKNNTCSHLLVSGVQAVCKIFRNIFGSVDAMSIKRTETTSFRMSICLDCTNGFWKGSGFCPKTDFQNMPKTLRPLLPTLPRGIRVTVY